MAVPGSNVLARAMGPIARQTLQWQAFVSRSVNAAGDFESVFAPAVTITGSFQAIDKKTYQLLGLNLQQKYSNLYTQADVKTLERDREGDIVMMIDPLTGLSDGEIWSCVSDQDWRSVDGWRKILCVRVPE